MTKRALTGTRGISTRLLVTLSDIHLAERDRPPIHVRDGILMNAVHTLFRFVAALALGMGMAAIAHAQTQTFCANYPCYHIFVNTTDGGGNVSQFSSITPFSLTQTGFFNGNQESAFGIANFGGSIGSKTSVDFVTCPTNCLTLVQANAGVQFFDVVDLLDPNNPPVAPGQMFQFSLSLAGNFGSGPPLASANAGISLINGNNIVDVGTFGNAAFPPQSSLTATVAVDPAVDRFLQVTMELDTSTALSIIVGFGSNFADFSSTFTLDNVALLDSSGNFLRNVVLTDTAGFTLPGTGSGPGTAPEPGTLLLVLSAVAVLGLSAGGKRHRGGTQAS